jgi:hypothetical protein
MKETYLGDGLYVSYHEGANSIRLRAPRFDRGSAVDHEVWLEPQMFVELLSFVGKHWDISQCLTRNPRTI